MTAAASGAEIVRPFDPSQTIHYAMSETTQAELATLFDALESISDLADGTPGDQGADLESHHYSPIFRALASYGKRLMADTPAVTAQGRRLKA